MAVLDDDQPRLALLDSAIAITPPARSATLVTGVMKARHVR